MEDKKPLRRYEEVVAGREKAHYLSCKDLPEKIRKADGMLSSCMLCERRCEVDRRAGKRGYCRVLESRVASDFIHWGEEPPLVPSYTIFFSGCNFRCVFCQNWDISQDTRRGRYLKPEVLAEMIEKTSGINVNWVGGDPTPNLPYILKVIGLLKRNIPQVWNSNMYLTEESMDLLDGVIDVYLTDFKYGNDICAKRLSDAKDYFRIVSRNHLLAEKQAEVIVRHLVLPGHVECCTKPILEWIAENMENALVNVMEQYHPDYQAMDHEELMTGLSPTEFREALDYAKSLGLLLVD